MCQHVSVNFSLLGASVTKPDTAFFAVLAIIAVVLGLAFLVIWYWVGNCGAALAARCGQYARPLAAAIASVATAGSLYFSEIREFEPCRWCWYQRIMWFPLALLLVVSVWKKDRTARRYMWPPVVVGIVIASYHHLIERYPDLADAASCNAAVPCTSPYFRVWGQITIAAMSLMGLVAIACLLWVDRAWDAHSAERKQI